MTNSIMNESDFNAICKNLVGFCNNQGGNLIIGVDSSFKVEGIVGIENVKYSIDNLEKYISVNV